MARWKEKRKPHCTMYEHKNLLDSYKQQEQVINNLREEKRNLEGALIKATMLLEVQGKQFQAIKLILSFFESAKKVTVNEEALMKRG